MQGKAREMAEALFALEQLSPEACRQAAESVGLDMEEYQQAPPARKPTNVSNS